MKVGDIVLAGYAAFRITGVYLGGLGIQNIVGLQPLTSAIGSVGGFPVDEMLVPEELVLAAGIYRRLDNL